MTHAHTQHTCSRTHTHAWGWTGSTRRRNSKRAGMTASKFVEARQGRLRHVRTDAQPGRAAQWRAVKTKSACNEERRSTRGLILHVPQTPTEARDTSTTLRPFHPAAACTHTAAGTGTGCAHSAALSRAKHLRRPVCWSRPSRVAQPSATGGAKPSRCRHAATSAITWQQECWRIECSRMIFKSSAQ